MYTIQANASGTRSIDVSEKHLETIEKYSLFQQLIDSNGIVDETVLDLCIDVIYHNNMKAFGLHQLILLYIKWEREKEEKEDNEDESTEETHNS